MKNIGTKTDNTAPATSGVLTAKEDNSRLDEAMNLVTSSGQALDASGPDSVDPDTKQWSKAITAYASGGGYFGQDSGAVNAHVLTSPSGASGFVMPATFFDGMVVVYVPAASNTGVATVNPWSLGIKTIKTETGADLAGGEIVSGQLTAQRYHAASDTMRLEPWANALNLGGGSSGSVTSWQNLPIYPEISQSGNVLAVTSGGGSVVVSAAQSFIHRGWQTISTDDYAVGARTFATTASKTYHLRWRWNSGSPLFELKDLADAGYNSGSLAETDKSFDTTFDDMLVARVVTDAGNLATVTLLMNKARLNAAASAALVGTAFTYGTFNDGVYVSNDFLLNWARTPDAVVHGAVGMTGPVLVHGVANNFLEYTIDRYSVWAKMATDWQSTVSQGLYGNLYLSATA